MYFCTEKNSGQSQSQLSVVQTETEN